MSFAEGAVGAAGLEIVRASAEDAGRLVEFLAGFDEVSLLGWQGVDSARRVLSQPTTVSLCARSPGGAIAGALIGGTLGTRGTINHVAVDAACRGQGIGKRLVVEFERILRTMGVRRYFLFVDRRNALGRNFWERRGFASTEAAELTYERDL